MKAKFLTDLECKLIRSGWWRNTWELLAPLRYYSEIVEEIIEAPLGFRLDFASVPRVPVIHWIYGGMMHRPAGIHDWIYRKKLYLRYECDLVFKEGIEVEIAAMKESENVILAGIESSARLVGKHGMYAGVRLGGHLAYGRKRYGQIKT